EDRLAQTRRYAFGDHGNLGTHRILVAAQLVHIGFQLRHLVRVGAEEGVLADRLPALEGNLDRTQLAHIATHSNALAGKILARNGAGRDPHRSLPGRGAPAATVVARAVLVVIAVVRMGRTEQVLDRR